MVAISALPRRTDGVSVAGDSVYCVTLELVPIEIPLLIWGEPEDFPNFPTHLGIFL